MVSEAVIAKSINRRSVVLTRNGTKVSVKVVYRPARHSILLRPTKPLKAGTYHLTVRTTITDVLGNRWDGIKAKRGPAAHSLDLHRVTGKNESTACST